MLSDCDLSPVTISFSISFFFFFIQRKEEIFQKGNKYFHTISFYYVFIEFSLQENMLDF